MRRRYTWVFFKDESALRAVEAAWERAVAASAVCIQRWARGAAARRLLKELRRQAAKAAAERRASARDAARASWVSARAPRQGPR